MLNNLALRACQSMMTVKYDWTGLQTDFCLSLALLGFKLGFFIHVTNTNIVFNLKKMLKG